MDSKELAYKIAELSLEKKATDVVIMDLGGLTSMADYFVICSGDTNTQVKAISDHLLRELRHEKSRPLHKEGISGHEWVLMDFVDVVAHVFQPHKREFYALEKLWGDAEITEIKDEL